MHWVEASAARTRFGVTHSRLLVLKERQWLLVVDRLHSSAEHTYRRWFGFHESLTVESTAAGFQSALSDGNGTLYLQELNDLVAEQTELVRGRAGDRPQGWISRKYLKKQPRYSAAFRRRGRDETFVTLLSLDQPARKPNLVIDGQTVRIQFVGPDGVKEAYTYTILEDSAQVSRSSP